VKSKFTKFNDTFPPLWRQFLSAGTEWIDTYETLQNYKKQNMNAVAIFYAPPFALSMSMECLVKALASFYDSTFDPFKYRHRTSDVIKDYASIIPLFDKISKNSFLIDLIKEYENTLDTKFGGTYVQMDRAEAEVLLNTACDIRAKVLKVSGVKF
jgi:hypothetical protein